MHNKKIVVTGSTRGIGREIVIKFAREGYDVAFCSRNELHVNDLKSDLQSINSNLHHIAACCDVSSISSLKDFCNEIKNQWEKVDILVNNAGIFVPGNILNANEGQMEKILDTNLLSAYHITRELIEWIKKGESSHIFNMGSIAGIQAYSSGALYGISKFAINGFSQSLREECKAYNIKVTTIHPGATFTDSWSESGFPPQRFIQSKDIAELVFTSSQLSPSACVEEIIVRPLQGDI